MVVREFIVYADEVTQTEVNVALTTYVIVRLFGSMGCVAMWHSEYSWHRTGADSVVGCRTGRSRRSDFE